MSVSADGVEPSIDFSSAAQWYRHWPVVGRTVISATSAQPLSLHVPQGGEAEEPGLHGGERHLPEDGLFLMLSKAPDATWVVQCVPSRLVSNR